MKAFQASFNNIFRYEIHLLTRILNTNLHLPHKNLYLYFYYIHAFFSKKVVKKRYSSFRYFFFCIRVYTVVIDFVILQLSFVFYLKKN